MPIFSTLFAIRADKRHRSLDTEKHLSVTEAVRSGLNQTVDQQPLRRMNEIALSPWAAAEVSLV